MDGRLSPEQIRLTLVVTKQSDQQEQYTVPNCMGRVARSLADGEMDDPVTVGDFTGVEQR